MIKKVTFLAVALLSTLLIHADDMKKYREFADTIRKEVYSMELPAFQIKEIPEKYKNESAVIKAVYEDVDAKKKTGIGVAPGFFIIPKISGRARVEFGHLTRMLIHINDKAAIEKYSEFDFGIDKKRKTWDGYEKNRHVMGVRLVKPDGRIVDIDTSEFVEVEEGKKGEKKSRKLAIPGLETGDDIDVFFYTESKLQNVHPDPMEFYLKDDAPILNYAIHCVLDDKLTTQYRTLNGAPDFTVSRDEDGNYVLDLQLTDISAKEPRLWYNPVMQSPLIKMNIYNRRNSDAFTPKSARKDGLQANPDPAKIIEDRYDIDDWWLEKTPGFKDNEIKSGIRDGGKILKEVDRRMKSGEMTVLQTADYLYNLLAYYYAGNRYRMNNRGFIQRLFDLFKGRKIPFSIGLSGMDAYEQLDHMIDYTNNLYFIKVESNGETRYYFPPAVDRIKLPSEIHAGIQGRKALLYRKKKDRKKNPATDFFPLPMSTVDDNRNVTTVNAVIDGQVLRIKRDEAYTGATKIGASSLLTWEDLDRDYSSSLGRIGFDVNVKLNKKQITDRDAHYIDMRKEQQDALKDETKAYHDDSPAEFTDGRITSSGIDPENPALGYELTYTMDNLVKRAGKNLIVSVGKLLSSQNSVLPSDRKRDDDIYMRTPREYITRINLSVPAGYKVSTRSLTALDKSVSNPSGTFSVKTSTPSDDSVSIDIAIRFAKGKLPVAEWQEFLKILDAASSWNASSLLLEKK